MCFSVQVDKDIKNLAKRFNASISEKSFEQFSKITAYEAENGPEKVKTVLGLKRKPSSSQFKSAGKDSRIYPGYFAPVIVWEDGKRIIKPMRYRVRPKGSKEEIPSKYNVFNARIDALEKRKTWNSLFMKNHALFPFVGFFEWVEDKNKKKILLNFNPEEQEIMWAPALYDTWTSTEGEISFQSFALITDEPPPEIEALGHDRCPIFLKENLIDQWLQPENKSKEKIYEYLKEKELVYFNNSKAAQSWLIS